MKTRKCRWMDLQIEAVEQRGRMNCIEDEMQHGHVEVLQCTDECKQLMMRLMSPPLPHYRYRYLQVDVALHHRGLHIKTYKSHGREVRDVHVTLYLLIPTLSLYICSKMNLSSLVIELVVLVP